MCVSSDHLNRAFNRGIWKCNWLTLSVNLQQTESIILIIIGSDGRWDGSSIRPLETGICRWRCARSPASMGLRAWARAWALSLALPIEPLRHRERASVRASARVGGVPRAHPHLRRPPPLRRRARPSAPSHRRATAPPPPGDHTTLCATSPCPGSRSPAARSSALLAESHSYTSPPASRVVSGRPPGQREHVQACGPSTLFTGPACPSPPARRIAGDPAAALSAVTGMPAPPLGYTGRRRPAAAATAAPPPPSRRPGPPPPLGIGGGLHQRRRQRKTRCCPTC